MTTESRRRRRWATATIRTARDLGPIPRYGTAEWFALDPGDARWLAAILVAAEAWETSGEDAADRLAVEIEAARAAAQTLAAEDVQTLTEQVRRTANRPTFAELERRRAS